MIPPSRSTSLSALLLASLLTGVAAAQDHEPRPWEQEIRDAARSTLADTGVPGLVIVVVDGGEVVISEALGEASILGPTPMTRRTVLRSGALGDLSIDLALLRLADQGALDLDAPIAGYADVHPAVGRVTANQLIDHTGGLRANHFSRPLWEDADLAREVRSWDERVFVAEPGETSSHSHYSIALAGYLVESVVGEPFDDAMRELVWGPVGADSATTRVRDLLTLPVGQGHRVRDGDVEQVRPLGKGFLGWPNALFVSLDDLDRFALALAEPETGGRLGGGGATSWRRSTSWGGVSFQAVVDVERRFCALVADNAWGTRAASQLAQTVRQVVLGHESPAPPPEIAWTTASPSVHELLVGVYENETTFEIAVRDGTLVLESGSSVEEVLQGEDNHFRARIQSVPDYPVWPQRFSVEASSDGKADRLRVGGRVWARRSDG